MFTLEVLVFALALFVLWFVTACFVWCCLDLFCVLGLVLLRVVALLGCFEF